MTFRCAALSLLLPFVLASCGRAEAIWDSVVPSRTDSDIQTFNTPHSICVDRSILLNGAGDRHELLLFLPGTGGHGRGARMFLEDAAELGYHTIELMYPDDHSASECDFDRDPHAFEAFRLAIIQGGSSTRMTIPRQESIENRLEKLLLYLQEKRPLEKWDQFLEDGRVAWENIAVAGQSQGGGHAALIAIRNKVARVIMFGAPRDFSQALYRPATWYSEHSATPHDRFFAINHQQDRQGCTFSEQLQNEAALHMNDFGAPADVDLEIPPYRHSHILTTNYPGTRVDSMTAHGTAINDRNAAVFRAAWLYMLTEPVVETMWASAK
jgi:hypothetical protein